MSILDRIGLDLGTPDPAAAPDLARAAADAGARLVRVRFTLGDRPSVDGEVKSVAVAISEAVCDAGLHLIGVVDGGLTVAPDGLGPDAPDALAAAWAEELAGNAFALAEELGDLADAWEVLPAPNAPGGAGLPPARWAAVVTATGRALGDAVPYLKRVAGGLWNDDADDGVDYLRAAAHAAGWHRGPLPFDGLGIQLRLFRDGGPSEGTVAATLSERAQRLWRAATAALGGEGPSSLWVTGIAWDAVYAGESAQARNAWAALDAFTANPDVAAVIWTGLVDGAGATGLYSGTDLSPESRRPAWRAFKDFALYAAQISPSPEILIDEDDDALEDAAPAEAEARPGAHEEPTVTPTPVAPQAVEIIDPEPEPVAAAADAAEPGDAEPDGTDPQPEEMDTAADAWDASAQGVASGSEAPEALEAPELRDAAGALDIPPFAEDLETRTEREAEAAREAEALLDDDGLEPLDVLGIQPVVVGAPDRDDAGEDLTPESDASADAGPDVDEAAFDPDAWGPEGPADLDAPDEASYLDELEREATLGATGEDASAGAEAASVAGSDTSAEAAHDAPDETAGHEGERAGGAEEAPEEPVWWSIPPVEVEDDADAALATPAELEGVGLGTEPSETAPDDAVEAPEGAQADRDAVEGSSLPDVPAAVTVRIPSLADVLRAQGLDGARLEAALRALEPRAAAPGHLPPPGDYSIAVDAPAASGAAGAPGALTNQAMLSALYRAGGGRWTLVERAGLDLTRLVASREAAYEGPEPASLPGLSDDEREAVRRALG